MDEGGEKLREFMKNTFKIIHANLLDENIYLNPYYGMCLVELVNFFFWLWRTTSDDIAETSKSL